MNSNKFKHFAGLTAALLALGSAAFAGTFKHITIDGSFTDWAGVPIAYTQAQDVTNVVAYQNVYLANDENYLYVRFSIYPPAANGFSSIQNFFFNTDNNAASGYSSHGVGSEMLIQSGAGYQEKGGGFNEGGVNGLDWLGAPTANATEFEFRVARNATFAGDGSPVFTSDTITLTLESDTSGFASVEWFPPSGGGVPYTFESPAAPLTNNVALISLDSSSWQANASGTDLSTNWLDQTFDDSGAPWVSGQGLFGFTPSPGSYPTIKTSLPSGPNTYYFRTHFNWNNDPNNVAFVVTNYLSDGAVYYVNGAEVRRIRMPSGNIAFNTSASGTNSPVGHSDVFGISGGPLVVGDNILEVETHQAAGSSADMVFGLSLTAAANFPVTIVNPGLPADLTVVAGQSATFDSDVIGSGPLTYQWLKDGSVLTNATNATLTIPLVVTNDAGLYSLMVINPTSTNTTRAALLTVTGTPVVITDPAQPADQIVVAGHPATLSVAASGSAVIQYQWFQDNNPVSGATNATYTIASTAPTYGGNYYVHVSNPVNATNSRVALLTVLPDTIQPSVTKVAATAGKIVLTFSEPLETNSADNASHYTLSGGATVSTAVINPANNTQVTLTPGTALTMGNLYTLTINGVTDLFGNATHTSVQLVPTTIITIDGDFSDWDGITPIYSGSANMDGAADFKDIYVFNDDSNYYFRVTLWHDIPSGSGHFPAFVNMFFNTDDNAGTGYSAIGSELLIQSGFSYQEKDGTFNDGHPINGLNWTIQPNAAGTNFEFSVSREATFSSDNSLVFPTNDISFLWQGQTPGFVALNTAPSDGGVITYSNVVSVVPPVLPLGQLSIGSVPGGRIGVVWDTGALQAATNLVNSSFTNVPSAISPYIAPASERQQYFRLTR